MDFFARLWGTTSDARRSRSNSEKLDAIETDLRRLIFIVIRGFKDMGTALTDVDAAIAADATQEQTLAGAVTTLSTTLASVDDDIATLLAKVNAGQQVDFSAELTAIQKNTAANVASVASINTAIASASAADATVNPPPAAAPVTPPASS